MLALAFLNPLLLWAIPLCAVPIVIHLLNRRRFQRVPWAAMEYLLAAMKRNRKRLRMEQWLVLLLRTLAVLLLALLVARPHLAGGSLLGTRTHHVVLLDDSASMQQRSGSVTLFDKAQDSVRQLAERLAESRGGDLFSLVRCSRPATPDLWGQRVGPDLGKRIATQLKELPAGDGTVDLGTLLQTAHKRAADTKEAGRTEYYLVSDQRTVDWLTEDEKPRPGLVAALAAMDAEAHHVNALAIGSRDADNLGLVTIRRVGRLTAVGVAVEFAIEVQNYGLDATPATELAVEVDGKSRVVQPVPQLVPGERTAIAIVHKFHTPGYHRLDASLPTTDHYGLDNHRSLVLPVQERSKALLVDGEPGESAADGETMFLQVALDQESAEQPTGIEPQVITDSALAETDLAPFDLVYLCNCPAPNAAVVAQLERFVAAGGGLVVFAGAQVEATRYNELLWRGGQGLLPLAFGELAGDPARPDRLALTQKDHPICGKLGETLDVVFKAAVLIKRHLTMVDDLKAGAAVMARIRDQEGSPAIVSRAFGNGGGQVIVFAFAADKHWSNWPDTFANLVVAQQVHRFAARSPDISGDNLTTRGSWRLALDPGTYKADVVVRALAGEGEERTFTASEPKASAAAPTEPPAGQQPRPMLQQLEVPMAELRGLSAYEVELQTHGGAPERRMFARNVPVEESKLIRFTGADFTRVYPPELHAKLTFREEAGGLGSGSGEGELWRALAAAMLLALLVESLLAWRFGRR